MSVQSLRKPETALEGYASNQSHLKDELKKLDLMIQLQKRRLQQAQTGPESQALPPASPVYISDEEVEGLLRQNGRPLADDATSTQIREVIRNLQTEIEQKVKESLKAGTFLALPQLAHVFGLSPFEQQVLILCLAPELDRKYDKLYAYLQDDITRKKPSVDLILNLLCPTEAARWQARAVFSQQAPLFRAALLEEVGDPQSPSGASDLARFLKLNARILNYLLGLHYPDDQLMDKTRLYPPSTATPSTKDLAIDSELTSRLSRLFKRHFSVPAAERKKLLLHFYGSAGVGKKTLAKSLCHALGLPLLIIDTPKLLVSAGQIENLLHLAFREALLQQAALCFDHIDVLMKKDDAAPNGLDALADLMEHYGWLCFFCGEKTLSAPQMFRETAFHTVSMPIPDVTLRARAWASALDGVPGKTEARWVDELASQFQLTPGQIRDAVQSAMNEAGTASESSEISVSALYAACRKQSNQKLRELALKISPRYDWQDIVLPEDKLAQLKELCQQVRHRAQVFREWGFSDKLSHGKGLSVLFSGPPGTGKTMAAEVIAKALQRDLYKIDLSSIVSKYIGETEKNLSKIFQEAESSNAILFFDEADALFGKRTEVSDAHDRYANIETSYLLQKMEEYEGVVILATNLRDNMDDAFTRRIRFIVEFPFPDADSRLQIWKGHFPKKAPLADDIDFDFLAKRVQVAGGNIKNIVLNAAFSAAEAGQAIGMPHLMHGVKREYEKIGKMWSGALPARSKTTLREKVKP